MRAPIVPARLRAGNEVRVVAPSRSRSMVTEFDHTALVEERFRAMGLTLTYGRHVDERDAFDSTSIAARVEDLHDAFADPAVAGILTVIGGYNANELLPHLDWDLIARNPKVFCGYSDITVLQAAMLARTGLITYSGPHWSSFGMRDHFEPTMEWFRRAVMTDEPVDLEPATEWTDDLWFMDQDARSPMPNDGWWVLRPGEAEGAIVGGNLCTVNLLQGTAWMPDVEDAVLFVEDSALHDPPTVARDLTSLLQAVDPLQVRALVIGRFQRATGMTRELLEEIVRRQPFVAGVPVIANVDFGHTSPQATIPIGGRASVSAGGATARLTLRST
ncbi:S66 family peptidase [Amnibacterium setariae]|uniref:S66 family peptidase n=1 Tax=Amnibacterium setariae TaxID=2306585 RepID=UPI001F1F1AA9|nr:S66 peptidase family protein [Amnibacterium setariae]